MSRRPVLTLVVALLALAASDDVTAAAPPQLEAPPFNQVEEKPKNPPQRQQRRAARPPRQPQQANAQPLLPAWVGPILLALAGVGVLYLCVILAMSLVGLVIAWRTRGLRALRFLGEDPVELTSGGQVVRVRGEAGFTRLYALTLVLGLVLFYVSVPFVLFALLVLAAALVYLLLKGKKFTGKGIALVVGGAAAMAWAILRSLIPRSAAQPPGLALTPAYAPRVHQVLRELAYHMDTEPVEEAHVTVGSTIAVQQEGSGLFGLFGTARRTLLLGYSSLQFLTVSELKALLAHEHAHFSQRDTFFSRLIYRVTDSIETALRGMRDAGGKLNYVNPFYLFLYLYYRAYQLLAVGFTRSREFLADRLASTLYGANVLGSGLTKVETEAVLHHKAVTRLVKQGRPLRNLYAEARKNRSGGRWADDSDRSFIRLLKRQASFFATQPGYRERIEALAALPFIRDADPTPAFQLFDDPAAIEEKLTDLLIQTTKPEPAGKKPDGDQPAGPIAASPAE